MQIFYVNRIFIDRNERFIMRERWFIDSLCGQLSISFYIAISLKSMKCMIIDQAVYIFISCKLFEKSKTSIHVHVINQNLRICECKWLLYCNHLRHKIINAWFDVKITRKSKVFWTSKFIMDWYVYTLK